MIVFPLAGVNDDLSACIYFFGIGNAYLGSSIDFFIICQLILGIVGNIIFGAPENGGSNILQSLFSLAVIVPSLAVFWRRMHDIDKSGLWIFLNFIPLIGQIILIVFEATDGHPGENRFGMSPKYPD